MQFLTRISVLRAGQREANKLVKGSMLLATISVALSTGVSALAAARTAIYYYLRSLTVL